MGVMVRIGECTHCGNCCKADVGFGVDSAGWCNNYRRGESRCSIYDDRPKVCREFPKTPEQALFCEGDGCYKFVEIGRT